MDNIISGMKETITLLVEQKIVMQTDNTYGMLGSGGGGSDMVRSIPTISCIYMSSRG